MRLGVFVVLAGLGLAVAARPAFAFEGSIEYRVADPKGGSHTMTMTLAGEKMRTEFAVGKYEGISIVDMSAHTVTMLSPEQKTYTSMPFDPAKAKSRGPKGKLSKTGATDTVAGYPVQEWVYETGHSKISLWLTDKLGRGFFQQSRAGQFEVPAELRNKGLALRISSDRGFKMEAVKVDAGSPDPSEFKIPEGYTETQGMGSYGGRGSDAAGDAGASDVQERLQKAMQNMTPEQKAMLQKMMQNQGAAGQ